MQNSERRTAREIFEVVRSGAQEELERKGAALAYSGFAGGLTMGLTALGVALVHRYLGDSKTAALASYAFYPLGFIAVLIGRAQLFTENTLFPVVLVLEDHRNARRTAQLWSIVLATNLLGAFAFALLAVLSGALEPEVVHQLGALGKETAAHPLGRIFWSGVMGGWLIALVAWTVTASHWTIGQIAITWLLTFVVGAARLAHCIAGSAEVLCSVVLKEVSWGHYGVWLVVATAGNIVGGVLMVSLLNYGQVKGTLVEGAANG